MVQFQGSTASQQEFERYCGHFLKMLLNNHLWKIVWSAGPLISLMYNIYFETLHHVKVESVTVGHYSL